MMLLQHLKVRSESIEESEEDLRHFGGILDHITKVITSIALLVGLQIFIQNQYSLSVEIMYWALWLGFFFYLLKLYQHCVMFALDRWVGADLSGHLLRWVVGLSGFAFNLFLVFWGNTYLTELAKIGFKPG